MTSKAEAKFNMIEQQIRPWEVIDPQVLETFDVINRDHFVGKDYKGLSYADCQLPVIDNIRMLPPTLEGRMLQALTLEADDQVLQIGSNSGYLTACIANLAAHVLCLDISQPASELAKHNIETLANPSLAQKIALQTISSLDDIEYQQRFDAITVCAGSIHTIPDNLKQALAIGGRLFVVTGQSPVKHACLVTRLDSSEWHSVKLFETDIPEL